MDRETAIQRAAAILALDRARLMQQRRLALVRPPRPPRVQPHQQPLTEGNKENLLPEHHEQLFRPPSTAVPATVDTPPSLGAMVASLAVVGRGGMHGTIEREKPQEIVDKNEIVRDEAGVRPVPIMLYREPARPVTIREEFDTGVATPTPVGQRTAYRRAIRRATRQ